MGFSLHSEDHKKVIVPGNSVCAHWHGTSSDFASSRVKVQLFHGYNSILEEKAGNLPWHAMITMEALDESKRLLVEFLAFKR